MRLSRQQLHAQRHAQLLRDQARRGRHEAARLRNDTARGSDAEQADALRAQANELDQCAIWDRRQADHYENDVNAPRTTGGTGAVE